MYSGIQQDPFNKFVRLHASVTTLGEKRFIVGSPDPIFEIPPSEAKGANTVDKALLFVGGIELLSTKIANLKALGGVGVANTGVERSFLGSSEGHLYAQEVLPGGTGTALTGHGEFIYGSGNVIVPKGSAITLPRDGIKILDETGRYIEAGDWNGLAKAASQNPRIANDIEGMTTWLPGSKVPNYTLSAPVNPPLRILQNSTTVESKTWLDQLLQPNMGCIQWAACTK